VGDGDIDHSYLGPCGDDGHPAVFR
jgi:hypothetical protein